MTGERTNGAVNAHEPNVCVVVIALERNDVVCVVFNNKDEDEDEHVGVADANGELISSLMTDDVGEEIVTSPPLSDDEEVEDDDTLPFDGGMSIVLISLPNIKRKRFFCGVI